MNFEQYQQEALKTDKTTNDKPSAIIVPLLGLAGEAGELLNEYKKFLRDGEAHEHFKERVQEELGDLLWYLSNTASKFDLTLEEIAKGNLLKCRSRWHHSDGSEMGLVFVHAFDYNFPEHERIPRQFTVELTEVVDGGQIKMKGFINGVQKGNDLTDNSYVGDGYRYHDVFHFAFAAVLGWSPIVRYLFACKRKSHPLTDEVEDGGRAAAIEEGISAMIFSYASHHKFLEGTSSVDSALLKTIQSMTSGLEVAECSIGDWERAILKGFEVWRQLDRNKGGRITINLDTRDLAWSPL
jgi:NTP pyrophosphatase (non-canonical NTP hydrolase)